MRRILALGAIGLVGLAAVAVASERGGCGRDGSGRAHWAQQKSENEAFRGTLRGMAVGDRLAAIKAHREQQYQENLAFFSDRYDRRVQCVRENDRLSDEQEAELISFLDVQYHERIAFYERLHQGWLTFIEELAASDKTPEERHSAVRLRRSSTRAAVEAFREAQRAETRAKIREILGNGAR